MKPIPCRSRPQGISSAHLTLRLSQCDLSACLMRLERVDYELESSIVR